MPASVLITCGNVVGRLWLHFSAVYIITGITCYLLYHVSNSTLFFAFLWLPTFSIFARHFVHASFSLQGYIPATLCYEFQYSSSELIDLCSINAYLLLGLAFDPATIVPWKFLFLLVSCVFINIFYIVFQEYKYISCKRLEYFMTSKPLPQHFTVLVRAIPVSDGVSVSDAVDKFFREYHSSTYLSHTVVHQTGKLRRLLVRFNSFFCFLLFLLWISFHWCI